MTAITHPRRIHYAWYVFGATFVVLLASAGVRSVPGVLILPLEREFGWSRATVSAAVSINLLLFGLVGPFAASVMERLGMRRMMLTALLIIATAVALTTRMRQPWQLLLLWGGMVGLGAGAMSGWLSATVANRWFIERRGMVVGLLTAAGATGQLIFLPLLQRMVNTVGWRPAVALVACTTLAVVPVVWAMIRSHPYDVGALPYGAPPETPLTPPPVPTGTPFAGAVRALFEGLRHPDFRFLAGSFFVCGATTNGLIGTHLIPASHEHGISTQTAASLLALIGVFDIVGTTLSGWLSDRYDNRRLLAWYYSLRGLSLLGLPYAFDAGYGGLGLFIVFYGLDWVATVPPTVRLTADIFGRHRVGTMFAWIMAAHQLGAATAAFGAGALRTWLGDYQVSFMSAGLLCLVAAGMVLRIGRVGDKQGEDRRQRLPETEPAPAA